MTTDEQAHSLSYNMMVEIESLSGGSSMMPSLFARLMINMVISLQSLDESKRRKKKSL